MGARVIRSQTMGDSIGCDLWGIEPKLGDFNPEAFKHIDYALKAAHRPRPAPDRYPGRRLRQLHVRRARGVFQRCRSGRFFTAFFTDPKVIARFEEHIGALLNWHKNSLTGIAYKWTTPPSLAW